jgi:DNA cross-link repair 1C protein
MGCALNILDSGETAGPDTLEFDQEDVTLKNLEGPGALEAAERWAESRKMVRTLETLRVYLTGRPRAFVDAVLNKNTKGDSGSVVSTAAVAGVGLGSRNAGQSRRYGASDEDTDDSDAENERARTAHKLFVEADLEAHSGWFSPSQSLDDGPSSDRQERKLSASPDRDRIRQVRLLTPTSSPVRLMMGSRNKGKKRQLDHDRIVSTGRSSALELSSPIQLSPPSRRGHYPTMFPKLNSYGRGASGSGSHHTSDPLVDLHNFGKTTTVTQ